MKNVLRQKAIAYMLYNWWTKFKLGYILNKQAVFYGSLYTK